MESSTSSSDAMLALPQRDVRIDFLRGAALLVIACNHIHGNQLSHWTPLAWGYWDMAEVFVFLSGYVTGISAARTLTSNGVTAWLLKVAGRCGMLYGMYVLTGTIFVLLVRWLGGTAPGEVSDRLLLAEAWELPWLVASLQYFVGYLAILPLYIVLLALAGPMLIAGQRSQLLLAAVSLALHLCVQSAPGRFRLAEPWQDALYFNPLAWQAVFFAGSILAPGSRGGKTWRVSRTMSLAAWGVVAGLSILSLRTPDLPWCGKSNAEPLRLVHFAATTIIAWRLTEWLPCRQWGSWAFPVVACGRNSLVVYCGGALLSAWATSVRARSDGTLVADMLLTSAVCAGCVLIGLIVEFSRQRLRSQRRQLPAG